MPKKKGLGANIEKSLSAMDDLLKALKKFTNMPIKKGLTENSIDEKDINKAVNDSMVEASSLINKIEDLQSVVKGIKPKGNSRFANRVVTRFLEQVSK
jgi:dihydroorotate dehydrogenase